MLTAPATPQSRHAVIEPITDVQDPRCGMQDPRNDIQALRSRLDREERRVTQLEEEPGRAKTQLEKYITDRNSLQEQQVQVVMKNDRDDIARFKDQVKGLRMLLEDREKDVSILEEEVTQKNTVIFQLLVEVRRRLEELSATNVSIRPAERAQETRL
jgi:chromosome segregation ATPase